MKRSFTLIETTLALFLFSILLTSLSFFYWKSVKDKKKLEELYAYKTEEHYFDMRLKKILHNLQEATCFYREEEALVFIFDNDIDEEPLLSQKVLGKISLDKATGYLLLTLWPHPEKGFLHPARNYLLLTHVEALDFSFYKAPNRLTPIAPPPVGEEIAPYKWSREWKKSYKELPHIVKLSIKRSSSWQSLELGYILQKKSQAIGLPS